MNVSVKNGTWMRERLAGWQAAGLERTDRLMPDGEGAFWLNLASNDYLNLARHPEVVASACRALEQYGAGSTSSRLICGTLPLHRELEERLARKKGCEAALVFGTGWMANAGIIPVLAGRGDLIFADKLVHASMIDACRLSGAELIRFAHNDCGALEERLRRHPVSSSGKRLILTESVFSMDGDCAPLPEIAALAEQYDALLMVDEAHAFGIFGSDGAGCIAAAGIGRQVDVAMGTLSKALGGYGGYGAGSADLRKLLLHAARSFIYTTAPPPAQLGAALGALEVLDRDPNAGARLLERAARFRAGLQAEGLDTGASASQIIPVHIGENAAALRVAERLREEGILAVAIRPPTVPPGTARLRLSVTLAHDEQQLEAAAKTIARIVRDEQ